MRFASRRAQLARLREISQVMLRHGLGFLLVEAGLSHLVPRARRRAATRGYHLRAALEELGPTFVKLGQALSTRRDLLPADVIRDLEALQDQAPPLPFSRVKEVIEGELRGPLEDVFASFTPEPLAAASIGQVHLAVTPEGRTVAVKVQRWGIEERVEADLAILQETAGLVEARTAWGKQYGLRDLVREFARTMRAEMDYRTEAERCTRFGENFAGDPEVRIPAVLPELTSRRVLTLQYESGVKITDLDGLRDAGYRPGEVARRLVRAMMRQIFAFGLFHADPHPGNLAVLPGEVIFFMDFGQVGQLTPDQQDLLQEGVTALARGDVDTMVQVALDLGTVGDLDQQAFSARVAHLVEKYLSRPMGGLDPVEAVRDALDLAREFRVRIPSAFALLGKCLGTLEAVVTTLDPDLRIMDMARPAAEEILRQRVSPRAALRRARRDLGLWWSMFRRLPRRLDRVIAKLDRDSLRIRFTLEDQEVLRRVERLATRLSLAILFLGAAVMVTGLVVAGAAGGALRLPAWMLSPFFLAAAGAVVAMLALAVLASALLGSRPRRRR
ncbi:MAG: AarF/ABC1/UbiB kinase family protein [Bacillota bacterium]|nr:AarF/ABC1/UbiB kinase family protein [Bacillota bacterium]